MNELTILVIEDDKTIQNFLKISLQTKGYKFWRTTACRVFPIFTRTIPT